MQVKNAKTPKVLWMATAYGLGFLLGAFTVLFFLLPRGEEASTPAGRWVQAPRPDSEKQSKALQEKIEQLEALGYLSGVESAPEKKGVTVYDRDRACAGINLVVSGHSPQAFLMDMKGRVMHTWHCEFSRAFRPDTEFDRLGNTFNYTEDTQHFRRAWLMENGDLLAIFEGFGLIKLDKDSNLLWARPNRAHHDLELAETGEIYVLTREAKLDPKINGKEPVLLDFISILDPQGRETNRISIFHAFSSSAYRARIRQVQLWPERKWIPNAGDFLHTNTLERLDGRLVEKSAAFKKGNLLIAIRQKSLVAVLDPESGQIVWATQGSWLAPHHPTVLDNGNMLIFDNLGGILEFGGTRVMEFDPFTLDTVWTYEGTEQNPFFSDLMGSCQRLPNGNTLITESQGGRAFEVTPEKKIVWEFLNPHRAGEQEELIAVLMEVTRIEPAFPLNWLEE